MKNLSVEEFSAQSEKYDAAVGLSVGVDQYCSSSNWILPANAALMPERKSSIFASPGHYWAFMRTEHLGGYACLEPLEAMWAAACPVVGADSQELALGIERICAQPVQDWAVMWLAGLPEDHPLIPLALSSVRRRWRLESGEATVRLVADLKDGMDSFLARRSKGFRRSLRRSQAKARAAGIAVEDASALSAPLVFERIIDVEKRAWKGLGDVGIVTGGMNDFYKLMVARLAAQRTLEVRFATYRDRDVAYILGGLCSNTYRGLQFSFDADFGPYGLGNVLQAAQMADCSASGVHHYDLGMALDYKRRWADFEHRTLNLFVIRV